ncbi:14171_t:CDS:2 [Racocetra fulgida]|uniref:14171_t:CDS:1 n=1 Tax=Racocetra fulgida TaxID=60492 RepID=A0A9N9BZ41_9GLOM|nr:14171_t:CDS:2 [Racocetra fulgida]
MSSKTFSLTTTLFSAFDDLKNEISKHFEDAEEELKLVHELIQTSVFQEPVDDSKFMMESLIKLMSAKYPTHPEIVNLLERLLITRLWNDITKPPTMLADYSYRSSDGSDYSRLRLFLQLGKAGTQYARSAPILTPLTQFPDAGKIFDDLMKRNKFIPHPSGISSTLFYLAIIITHDLFNSDPQNYSINQNSSYLDLSPLYGSSNEDLAKIRTGVLGSLKPDTFADSRILIQPPGVGALLIVFSRNHNYIANYLYETGKFKDDEHLFQTARLINCGYYLRVILHNYLETILGLDRTQSTWYLDPTKPYSNSNLLLTPLPTGIGNQVSLEFNFIYRWHPAISEADAEWINNEFKKVLGIDDPEKDPSEWTFNNMKRDKNGKFKDSDIAEELIKGTDKIAGSFGANNIPLSLRIIEITGIQTARDLGLASLNDFRKFLNLKPYTSFEDMTANKEVAAKLQNLYGDINNVELYPGLMTEKTKPPNEIGSAFSLPFTISRAILSDAINLVRNDRFHTDDSNPHNLAYWNWKNLEIPDEQLAAGGIIHQLFFKNLPNCYPTNSSYALFPFTVPAKTKEILKERGDDLWEKINYIKPDPQNLN